MTDPPIANPCSTNGVHQGHHYLWRDGSTMCYCPGVRETESVIDRALPDTPDDNDVTISVKIDRGLYERLRILATEKYPDELAADFIALMARRLPLTPLNVGDEVFDIETNLSEGTARGITFIEGDPGEWFVKLFTDNCLYSNTAAQWHRIDSRHMEALIDRTLIRWEEDVEREEAELLDELRS